jgi:hypothetical protein
MLDHKLKSLVIASGKDQKFPCDGQMPQPIGCGAE